MPASLSSTFQSSLFVNRLSSKTYASSPGTMRYPHLKSVWWRIRITSHIFKTRIKRPSYTSRPSS